MSEQTKFKGFKSIEDVKKHYGVAKLDIKTIKKGDGESYNVVMANDNIIALTQGDLDFSKPMTFGISDVDKLRLINFDPSKRVELKTVHTL